MKKELIEKKKELEKEENERLQRLLAYENDDRNDEPTVTSETEVVSAMDQTEEDEQPDTHDSSPHHDAEDTGRKPE